MGRQRRSAEREREVDIETGTAVLEAVAGEPDSFVLWVNGVPSSCVTLSDPLRLDFEYLDWMSRIIRVRHDDADGRGTPLRAVHIGAGGCSLPRWIDAHCPGSKQTAIDIDAVLLEKVREWFDLPKKPRLALRAGDGAREIHTFRPSSLDVLVRDAFAGSETPAPLATREFFDQCANVLAPSGTFLLNIAAAPPHERLKGELRLLQQSFPYVALAIDPGNMRGRRYGNAVGIAAHTPPEPGIVARALRGGPAVARVLEGTQLTAFTGR
ncbi:spermidine synthase [Brevibacterium ravenspurgense]|uniref:spermidine synthase n=1 Tax=Brevibacterium ravenspurgense TaxID=479117 RepID=UPI000381CAE0|nr:fused MFS/spermidine synthase [Brevibacterium ravenspurgense]